MRRLSSEHHISTSVALAPGRHRSTCFQNIESCRRIEARIPGLEQPIVRCQGLFYYGKLEGSEGEVEVEDEDEEFEEEEFEEEKNEEVEQEEALAILATLATALVRGCFLGPNQTEQV